LDRLLAAVLASLLAPAAVTMETYKSYAEAQKARVETEKERLEIQKTQLEIKKLQLDMDSKRPLGPTFSAER